MRFVWEQDLGVEILGADFDGSTNLTPYDSAKKAITEKLREGSRLVMFDMTGVDFADEADVAALAACARLARQLKSAFALFNPHRAVTEALERATLTGTVPYRWDREQVIEEMHRAVEDPDPMAQLVRGNAVVYRPSKLVRLDKVLRKPREARSAMGARMEKAADPQPVAPGAEDRRGDTEREGDWRKAQEIYRAAAALARKYDLDFDGQTTFERFTALLSARIHDRDR